LTHSAARTDPVLTAEVSLAAAYGEPGDALAFFDELERIGSISGLS
jgi:hypothetical protein